MDAKQEPRRIDALDVISKLDPKSDTYEVMSGLAFAVGELGVRCVKWKTLAWVAIIGNAVQYWASLP
jgi:hypothetical protein